MGRWGAEVRWVCWNRCLLLVCGSGRKEGGGLLYHSEKEEGRTSSYCHNDIKSYEGSSNAQKESSVYNLFPKPPNLMPVCVPFCDRPERREIRISSLPEAAHAQSSPCCFSHTDLILLRTTSSSSGEPYSGPVRRMDSSTFVQQSSEMVCRTPIPTT